MKKMANCLLKHGVDLNKINKKGLTLLHIAWRYEYDNVVKELDIINKRRWDTITFIK